MAKAPRDLGEAIRKRVLAKDGRFPLEAYRFLYEALDHTIRRIGERRHVTGHELLDGIRDLAEKAFGFLAKTVFENWGLKGTEDWGRIVFFLVDSKILSRTEQDRLEDFQGVYDFGEALESGYQIPIRFDPKSWKREYAGLQAEEETKKKS